MTAPKPKPLTFEWPTERPHNAVVVRVTDGDTIVCDIDLDLKVWLRDYPVRLYGCNAAERSTEGGQAAKANLIAALPPGTPVVLTLLRDYKYGGEFVARVWVGGRDLVGDLTAQQWVAAWNGSGPRPTPPWPRTVA